MPQETKFLVVATTIVLLAMIMALVVLYSLFLQKKSKLLIAHQQKERNFEKELGESLNEMKEQTMKDIGLELHDNVGQKLSVVKIRTDQLSNKLDGEERIELEEVSDILKECIQDVRMLSKSLNISKFDDFSLTHFIQMELKRLQKIEDIKFNLDNQLNEASLKIRSRHGLIIFRMIQETLHNTYKHAEAKNINIHIYERNEYYEFVVEDDGKGFDTTKKYEGKGLQNLKDRALMINAYYNIISKANKGSKTIIKYYKK